jgi:hypothetical protein
MSRLIDPTQLVSAAEIARRLSLKGPGAVHNWRHAGIGFPPPVGRRRAFLWYWPDVESWARRMRATVRQARVDP